VVLNDELMTEYSRTFVGLVRSAHYCHLVTEEKSRMGGWRRMRRRRRVGGCLRYFRVI